jgi:hypothetical protein
LIFLVIFRIEHWVEKLSLTGSNATWRRDRDLYAKMLLNMVISKKLEEPFDRSPAEGPLAPFPQHLRCKLKGMMGPHETTFWRDVYANVGDKSKERESILISQSASSNRPSHSNSKSDHTLLERREHDNLVFLNHELERKVMLLEQQLHEERLQHEIELQRLLNHQRNELLRLKDASFGLKTSSSPPKQRERNNDGGLRNQSRGTKSTATFESMGLNQSSRRSDIHRSSVKTADIVPNASQTDMQTSFALKTSKSPFAKEESSAQLDYSNFDGTKSSGLAANKLLDQQERLNQELTTKENLLLQQHLSNNESNNSTIPEDESDFLKYLERFQNEIKKLQYKPT